MKTLHLRIRTEEAEPTHPLILQCAEIIKAGGLVAVPTETVYGLAGDALRPLALERIFAAKERPAWDPLIVHIAALSMVSQVATEFPPQARDLAKAFWPGPLTMLLKKSGALPREVTAGRDLVAVRFPAHVVARDLITASGTPLAAPSANRFGRPSPTTAEHVLHDLDGRIDAVLDAGPTNLGVESTVLDPLHTPPQLLRPGGITREQIEAVVGTVELYVAPPDQPPKALASPGLSGRHYAPEARVEIVEGERDALLAIARERTAKESKSGNYVGVLAPEGWLDDAALAAGGLVIFDWGQWGDWTQLAHNLFSGLRYLDKPGVTLILAPLPPPESLALALRDRLSKAAK